MTDSNKTPTLLQLQCIAQDIMENVTTWIRMGRWNQSDREFQAHVRGTGLLQHYCNIQLLCFQYPKQHIQARKTCIIYRTKEEILAAIEMNNSVIKKAVAANECLVKLL